MNLQFVVDPVDSLPRLPSPHLRVASGLSWHDVKVDGEDKLKLDPT